VSAEDPTTEELRIEQLQREAAERDRAGDAIDVEEAEQHERRADKARYLRDKLEERAAAERRAAETDEQGRPEES
jgi:hypothetical protein